MMADTLCDASGLAAYHEEIVGDRQSADALIEGHIRTCQLRHSGNDCECVAQADVHELAPSAPTKSCVDSLSPVMGRNAQMRRATDEGIARRPDRETMCPVNTR